MRQGRPQKYGTQYLPADLPRWAWWLWWARRFRLWDVDPTTTDAERAEWGVPPLEIAREQAATIGQPRPPTRLGPTIMTLELGELHVEVQDIHAIWAAAPASAGAPPRAEPLRPGDAPGPVALPEGGSFCRVGESFGIADAEGKVIVLWRREPAPAGEPYRHYWRWAHAPRLVEASVDGQAAVWIEGEPDGGTVLITRADVVRCWCVWGVLPREELLRVARSLRAVDQRSSPYGR